MAGLREPVELRGVTIKNRIVMEPMVTFSFHGDGGSFYGSQHLEHYTARAKGGVGLILIQATAVFGASRSEEKWSPDNTAVLRRIADNCHRYGAAVMMQLSCGDLEINGLTLPEIRAMQRDMVRAAATACALGFDGAEFHFAHGYTLCKFLDASHNRRTDRYGGDASGRAAILTEILPEIREETGERFLLSVRMGGRQPTEEDAAQAARIFERAGVDLLNISFGMEPPLQPAPEGFPCSAMTYDGCRIKQEVGIPVIAVNGIRTGEQVRYLIENDCADFAGIGRGMLADPEFANHVLGGGPVNRCLDCPECFWFTDHTRCPARKAYLRKD